MTDQPIDPASSEPSPAPAAVPAPVKKKRKRRLILKLLGVLIVLVVLIVALLPTIISLGAVRTYAAGKISEQLNGRVEIGEWSFGWFSPIRVQGVKVFDKSNALVLEADEIKTDLTLSQLARQNFKLGETVIDANLARLQVRPDGSTNLLDVFVKTPATPAEPATPNTPPPTETAPSEITLPDVSGNITLRLRGTVELLDAAGRVGSVVQLRQGSGGTINLPDINSPITTDLKFVYDVDNKPQGTIALAGTADAINNNKIDTAKILDTFKADLKLTLANVDLSAAKSILVLQGRPLTDVAGIVDGTLALKADGILAASAEGVIAIKAFGVTDPALSGDSFSAATVTIPVKLSRTVIAGGDAQLKPEKLRIELPQGFVDVSGDLQQSAIENLLAGRSPGSKGWVSVTLHFPGVGDFAKQLKETAKLLPEVKITDGTLGDRIDIAFFETKVVATNRLDVALKGTNAKGEAIAVQPIVVTFDSTLTPGPAGLYVETVDASGKKVREIKKDALLNALSDFAFVVVSDFANVRAGGPTVVKLTGKGDVDLGKLRAEIEQFRAIGDIGLGGKARFALTTNGDPSVAGSVKAGFSSNVDGLDLSLPGRPRLKVGFAAFDASATLLTGTEQFLKGIETLTAKFAAGDKPNAPLANGELSAEKIDLATTSVGHFAVTKVEVSSLPAIVSMIKPLLPPAVAGPDGTIPASLADYDVKDGQLYLSVAGSFDGKTKTLTLDRPLELSTPNLTVSQAGQALLTKENIRVVVLGKVGLPTGGVRAKFDTLTVSSSFASITKSAEPFELNMDDAGVTGGGSLPVSVDLVAVNKLVTALGLASEAKTAASKVKVATADPNASAAPKADVRGGKFEGVLQVLATDPKNARVQFDGTAKALTIAYDNATPLQNEDVKLSAIAASSNQFASVDLQAAVQGSFFSLTVKDTSLVKELAAKAGDPATYQLARANVVVGAPDLARLHILVKAFVPSLAASPLEITSGGAAMNLAVTRDAPTRTMRVNLTQGAISKLGLRNGDYAYKADPAKPITFALAAEATMLPDGTVDAAKVTQLAFDAGVAQVTMPEPIVMTNLVAAPRVAGKIVATGKIESVAPLLSALQGAAPLKYAGLFHMEQSASTSGDVVALKGSGTIDDFATLGEDNQPTFTEKQLTFTNDLSADLKTSSATIKSLTLAMPTSGALDVKITGGVSDWVKQRDIAKGTVATIHYDLPKIWPIVYASMSPEQQKTFKDAKISGKFERQIALGGSYPDLPRWQDSIQKITLDGRLSVESFDGAGITLAAPGLDLGITGKNGRFITDAKPAKLNDGLLNLGGIIITVSDDVRIDIAKNTALISNMTINPLLGDSIGKYVNPVFAGSERAKGLLGVTVKECKALATGDKLNTPESGSATIAFSIVDMDIANPVGKLLLGPFLDKVGQKSFTANQTDAFEGQIRQGVITVENGRTTQDLTMELSRPVTTTDKAGKEVVTTQILPLSFKGDIRLKDLKQKLSVNVPTELLASLIPEKNIAKVVRDVFPNGVPVEMAGTSTAPKVDYGNILEKIGVGLVQNQITGGKGGKGDDGKDLLGGILDQLGGKKDKDKDKKDKK